MNRRRGYVEEQLDLMVIGLPIVAGLFALDWLLKNFDAWIVFLLGLIASCSVALVLLLRMKPPRRR